MKNMLPAFAAALAVGAIGLASAPAQDARAESANGPIILAQGSATGQSGTILSERDVRTKLQMEGYTNVSNLKHEGNKYSAMATKNGQTVSVLVDARTGEVQSSSAR